MKRPNAVRWYALLLVAVLGCGWGPWPHSSVRPTGPAFADDALDGYLPPDAGAVYTLNPRPALDTPAGRRLAVPMRQFLEKEKADHPWVDYLGGDLLDETDGAQFIFCPPDLDHPLVLLRGRFDAARFAVGPGKLREASDGPFAFFELAEPRPGAVASLAQVGGCVAVCDSRPRFLAALNHAAAPAPAALQDARLHELLHQVDQKQFVWLAVSFDKLGPIPRLSDLGLETVLRPVLKHAESVRGGVAVGDAVRGEFIFRARGDADAGQLEQDLTASCTVAQGAYLIPGLDPSLLPLLEFMGTGTTTREGREITLRCRLPADRIAP